MYNGFVLFQDIKVLRSPSPQPRPDPIEKVDPETFTVEQIKNLYRQVSILTIYALDIVTNIKFNHLFLIKHALYF